MFDNERLAPVATYFINNRIVDLESEKVVKFKFSQEQVQSLHPELYAKILEFVGFELYGYPEDKAEKAEETTEEVIEEGKAKKAPK